MGLRVVLRRELVRGYAGEDPGRVWVVRRAGSAERRVHCSSQAQTQGLGSWKAGPGIATYIERRSSATTTAFRASWTNLGQIAKRNSTTLEVVSNNEGGTQGDVHGGASAGQGSSWQDSDDESGYLQSDGDSDA